MWQQLRNANRRTKAFNKYDCRCMNVCGSVVISMCVCASCVCVVGLTQCVCQSVYRLFVLCLLLVMQMSGEKSNSLFREGEQGCVSEGERLKRALACRRGEA